MPEPVTVEGALVTALAATQQIERLGAGSDVAGLAYATGVLLGELLDVLDMIEDRAAEAAADSEEEN